MTRSPVFKAMLTHNMIESQTGEIQIDDRDFSLTAVKELLHYMYTGELTDIHILDDEQTVGSILAVALKYQVGGLVAVCEAHLTARLNEENAADLLIIADGLNAHKLKEKTLQFIGILKGLFYNDSLT